MGGFIAVEPLREKPAGVSEPEEWGAVGVAEEAVVGRDFQRSVSPGAFGGRGREDSECQTDGSKQTGEPRGRKCDHGIGLIIRLLWRKTPGPSGRSGCKIRE